MSILDDSDLAASVHVESSENFVVVVGTGGIESHSLTLGCVANSADPLDQALHEVSLHEGLWVATG